jgi:hypothetical protein
LNYIWLQKKLTTQKNTNKTELNMKIILNFLHAITLLALIVVLGTSCRKSDKISEQPSPALVTPTSAKPELLPAIPETQMLVMNKFNPATYENDIKLHNTDEVYGTTNDRSYAYIEINSNKIRYNIYGGASEDQVSGRWFNRKILQWDSETHSWKTFFDDGTKYFSRISDDISLETGSWYYTVQWVWDPAGNKWIKFDADLLIHA